MTALAPEDSVEGQAAAWVARLHGGDPRDEDFPAFEAWLAASPANGLAYDRAERLWSELGERRVALRAALDARGLSARAPDPISRTVAGGGADIIALDAHRRFPAHSWMAAGIALGVAAAALLAIAPARWRALSPPAQGFATARGETRAITLADGSTLRLSTQTRIEARITPAARRITLIEGEASFAIAHDPTRPFTVLVGDQEVRDVGTEFDIARHDGRIALTVRSGAVDVRPAGAAGAPIARLTAGQALKRAEGGGAWTVVAAQSDDAFAWTRGYLIYRDAPLTDVADDLSRYSPVRIEVDPSARILRFSGVLQIDRPEAMLRRLEAFAPVQADRAGHAITLRSKT